MTGRPPPDRTLRVRLLLTGGPTREHLDPVRFLSNASSGLQAVTIAEEATARGWAVDLVHGPLEVGVPSGIAAHPVVSAEEMLRACLDLHPACDVLIGVAAVSDYRPAEVLLHKRSRWGADWVVRLVPTADILAELGRRKGNRIHVGFALQTGDLLEGAARKLREKSLDLVVANTVEAIGAEGGRYHILTRAGEVRDLGPLCKRDLARRLLEEIEPLLPIR